MIDDKHKIELSNLLYHMIERAEHCYIKHIFNIGRTQDICYCYIVVDSINDLILDLIDRMKEVVKLVLGLKLTVNIYTFEKRVEYDISGNGP